AHLTSDEQVSDDWYINQSFNVPTPTSTSSKSSTPQPEPFIPKWLKNAAIAERRQQGITEGENEAEAQGLIRLEEIVEVLKEERGQNLVVIDMKTKCDFTDFLVIVEGRSAKQVHALVDSVRRKAKRRVPKDTSLPPNVSVEGGGTEDWMVLDIGRFIVHAFTPEARTQYNLEGLWTAIKDPLLALSNEAELDNELAAEEALTAASLSWESHPESAKDNARHVKKAGDMKASEKAADDFVGPR
ncbi:hypothetical protein HK097_006483, partial [Rhizophlyctis rosea]